MNRTEYMRQWRAANRDKWDSYMKEYRATHREAISVTSREWKQSHAQRHAELNAEWEKRHPLEAACAKKAAHANKYYSDGPKLTRDNVLSIVRSSKRKCYWCKKKIARLDDLTLEHLRPNNELSSLVIACRSCNGSRCAVTGKAKMTEEERRKRKTEYFLNWRNANKEHRLKWEAENRKKNKRKRQ